MMYLIFERRVASYMWCDETYSDIATNDWQEIGASLDHKTEKRLVWRVAEFLFPDATKVVMELSGLQFRHSDLNGVQVRAQRVSTSDWAVENVRVIDALSGEERVYQGKVRTTVMAIGGGILLFRGRDFE